MRRYSSKSSGETFLPLALRLPLDHVPLVDDNNARLHRLLHEHRKLLVHLRNLLGAIDQHEDHVGSLDRALGAVEREPFDALVHRLLPAESSGINREDGLVAELETYIDRVARCAGNLGHDHPRLTRERVDQCALARVSLADERDLEISLGLHVLKRCLGHQFPERVDEFTPEVVVLALHAIGSSNPSRGKLVGVRLPLLTVTLGRDDAHRDKPCLVPLDTCLLVLVAPARPETLLAQELCNLKIGGRDPRLTIDAEQNQISG